MTLQIFFGLLFTTAVGAAYVAVNLYVGWFIFRWRSATAWHRRRVGGRPRPSGAR